jgi:hypothetical protein
LVGGLLLVLATRTRAFSYQAAANLLLLVGQQRRRQLLAAARRGAAATSGNPTTTRPLLLPLCCIRLALELLVLPLPWSLRLLAARLAACCKNQSQHSTAPPFHSSHARPAVVNKIANSQRGGQLLKGGRAPQLLARRNVVLCVCVLRGLWAVCINV